MNHYKNIIIGSEQSTDKASIFRLHYEAFGNREDESKLTERIRASEEYIPELSLVAIDEDGSVVGHALFSIANVFDEDKHYEVIVLGPIAVKPSRQKQGIGGLLISEGFRISADRGYTHVFLIGHPSYYPRFGFEQARDHGFELRQFEVSNEVFMVKILCQNDEIKGELRYPQAFFE